MRHLSVYTQPWWVLFPQEHFALIGSLGEILVLLRELVLWVFDQLRRTWVYEIPREAP